MKMKSRLWISLIALSILYGPHSRADDQKAGVISGIVLNSSTKEVLPGANVVVVGTVLGAATDLEGRFTINFVPTGTYAVRASVLGFQPLVISDAVVTTAKPVVLEFNLIEMELELDEVTVTAGYFRTSPDKPVSTTVQSAEEIRRLPGGFEDVVRAISILPGVAQVSPGRNDLIIRGGAPSENLYVVDNIEVPNINHYGTQGSAGGAQSYINLDFVDNTRFSTGGFGVRYGDRLSSVLSIDLREGRQDRLGGKGTISATQFGLDTEGPLGGNGSFLVSARRSYLDFIFKAADFAFVPEYWDFLGKASYDLGPRDRISALGIVALDQVRLFNDTPDQRFDNSRILAPEQVSAVGGIAWRRLLRKGFATVTLGQSYVDYQTEQSDSLLNPIFRNNSTEQEISLKNDFVFELTPRTELSFGLQGTQVNFDADLVLDTLQTSFGETLFTDAIYDTISYKAAAYLQISHKFRYLRWTFGGRVDYFSLLENGVAFSPRLALSYPLTPHTDLNLSIGRYYQSPAYIWLVSQEQNRQLNFIGVNQYITGFDHLLRDDTKLTLEVYYKDYFDYPVSLLRPYLILVNTGSGYGGFEEGFASYGLDPLVSEGEGWSRGAELTLQKRFSDRPYYGLLAISYNQSKFRALDGVERPSSYDQRWIVNLGGGYLLNNRWELAGKFRLATGRPYTPYEPDGSQLPSRYNSARVDPNHSLDLRIDRRWYFADWVLTAYVDVQNVYNNKSNQPPRWNEREGRPETPEAIGILPSIGLSVEF
jgi:hypothetical protein